jgi:hypothetical protein
VSTNCTVSLRVKILLRFAYAHVQMMLYRPLLQFSSHATSLDATSDRRYFSFAIAGIQVCRNIIHIGQEIRRQNVLIGPYWFITYTQFCAVLGLILYILQNPNHSDSPELLSEARLGKECISSLTQRSLAADRVTAALNVSIILKSTVPTCQFTINNSNTQSSLFLNSFPIVSSQ